MAVYSYTAHDAAQRLLSGTMTAESPAEGRQRLRERGLAILEFAPARTISRVSFSWRLPRRRRQEQVAEVCRYLALLLRASVPISEALNVLARGRTDRLAIVLKDLAERLGGGASLAEALNAHEEWFPVVVRSAVRVGELSGNLEEALTDLAEHLRARESLRQQITGALAYPCILCCVGLGVVIFLMTYVIPQLLTVLNASGRPLPMSTMVLKRFSDVLLGYWPFILLGVVVTTIALSFFLRRDTGARLWQRALLKVPLAAPLVRKAIVAEFAQVMTLLLKTGIPFVEAVRTMQTLTRNRILRDELQEVARSVESGSDIAPTLAHSRIFPPLVVHVMAVGQDSGELTALLAELKQRYESEVKLAVERFTTVLEPLLIVVLAGLVGFVVFACLMPILEATRGMTA